MTPKASGGEKEGVGRGGENNWVKGQDDGSRTLCLRTQTLETDPRLRS